TNRRAKAEHREVVAGHIHTAAIHRSLPRHAQIDAEQERTGDSTERGVRLLEVPEHRVAEHLVAVAGVVARVAAELRTGRLEVDEPARGGDPETLAHTH